MEKKVLGKIEQVEFGCVHDREYLFGLILCLKTSDSSGVVDMHVVNMSKSMTSVEWNTKQNEEIVKMVKFVNKLLKDAKIKTIDQLVNVPIEMIFSNNLLKSFRILTEVL